MRRVVDGRISIGIGAGIGVIVGFAEFMGESRWSPSIGHEQAVVQRRRGHERRIGFGGRRVQVQIRERGSDGMLVGVIVNDWFAE